MFRAASARKAILNLNHATTLFARETMNVFFSDHASSHHLPDPLAREILETHPNPPLHL